MASGVKDLYVGLLFDRYSCILSEKQKDIVSCYYYADLSLSEIAENQGITRQAVSDILRRSEKQLRSAEESIGVLALENSLKAGAEKVRNGGSIDELLKLIDNI